MRAVHVTRLDGPGSLEIVNIDEPAGGDDKVVIDVAAAGVAWPDLLQTRGQYQLKPDLPFSPGAELAGMVRSAPAGSGLSAGQRVVAFTMSGAWQETVALPAAQVLPLPDNVSWNVGAGFLLNYLTMHFALKRRGGLRAGETVLVHGATGGVGEAAIRLGALWGARTLAVVSTEAKAQAARAAGADEVLLAQGFKDRAKELTDGQGVDIVVDPVGGDRFTDSLRALGREGRMLVIGFTGGEIPTVKVNRLLLNNISVVGVAWGEFIAHHPSYLREQADELMAALADGSLVVPDGPEHPLEAAGAVLAEMDERRLIGKAVLLP
ncbi:MAG: NADPH:quinone oxidoreductase family protein [Actinomycetota bacterium]|nr:NADPH:quinone oxidoreductase family protein [Actinomycetota bacterium]